MIYTATYSDNFTEIGELKVPLPDMPPEKEMKNYGLAPLRQRFKREVAPNMSSWPAHKVEEYVRLQWHRRLNGEWWLIKGIPMYFPGTALYFFDFWVMHKGDRPKFKTTALQLFQVLNYIERDPNIMGLFMVKVRRMGVTENIMAWVAERTTRYHGVNAGIQSYTDVEAAKNFRRLAKGIRNMPFFFKPTHSGSDSKCLAFMKPSEVMSMKKIIEKSGKIEDDGDGDFLGSYIDYEATVNGKYDGDQLFTYNQDETFKIPKHKMDITEQWNNIRRCLSTDNEMTIFGKAVYCSTIEEKSKDDDASTVALAQDMWDQSDPNNLDENGRTQSGMIRLFMGFLMNAPIDDWGFPNESQAQTFRDNKIKALQAAGNYAGILDTYRKEAATPEEAFSTSSAKCPLYPEMCIAQLNNLRYGTDRYGSPGYTSRIERYDLIWTNGMFSDVRRVPNKNGRWHMSQDCIRQNNVKQTNVANKNYTGTTWVGGNMSLYRMGADPYDATDTVAKGSFGSFAVKRRFNELHEKDLLIDQTGRVLNPEAMITNTYVCDYMERPATPYEFYEDVLKTCWYFGIAVFPESSKPGLQTWFRAIGCYGLVMFEPQAMLSTGVRRNPQQGGAASERSIALYVNELKQYVHDYVWNCQHPRILEQWARFIPAKRTKFDLAVATGFTELADMEERYIETVESGWKTNLYNVYEN